MVAKKLRTVRDIYNYLAYTYGSRDAWITDIAHELGITYEKAGILTRAIGYNRGKRNVILTPLNMFLADERVKTICNSIIDKNN